MSFWNDDNTKLCRELWLSGLSAMRCAQRLGTTRNAVIGRMMRTGVSRRGTIVDTNHRSIAARPRTRRPRIRTNSGGLSTAILAALSTTNTPLPSPSTSAVTAFSCDGTKKTLLDLQAHDCRWPIGNPADRWPAFGFCGALRFAPHDGFNQYCARHSLIAFNGLGNVKKRGEYYGENK